jgi:hypothetical protein
MFTTPTRPRVSAELRFTVDPAGGRSITNPFHLDLKLTGKYRGQKFTVTGVFPPKQTVGVYVVLNISVSAHAVVGGEVGGGIRLYLALPLDTVLASCWGGFGDIWDSADNLDTVMQTALDNALTSIPLHTLMDNAITSAKGALETNSFLWTNGSDSTAPTLTFINPGGDLGGFTTFLSTLVGHLRDNANDIAHCLAEETQDNLVLGVEVFLTGGVGLGLGVSGAQLFSDLTGTGSASFEMPLSLWSEVLSAYAGAGEAFLAGDLVDQTLLDPTGDQDGNDIPDWVETAPDLSSLLALCSSLECFVRDATEPNSVARFAQEAQVGLGLGVGLDAAAQALMGLDGSVGVGAECAVSGEFVLNALKSAWARRWQADSVPDLANLFARLDTPDVTPECTLRLPIQGGVGVSAGSVVEVGIGVFGRLDFLEATVQLSPDALSLVPRVLVTPTLGGNTEGPFDAVVNTAVEFSGQMSLYEDITSLPPDAFSNDVGTYLWDFGDGTQFSGTGPLSQVTHSYTAEGVYRPVLTITDTQGDTGRAEFLIFVTQPP